MSRMIHLVSRHSGAQALLQSDVGRRALRRVISTDIGGAAIHCMPHLDIASVKAGDIVVGNLPIAMIADVYDRGGVFVSLDMDVPANLRGQELSAAQMTECRARLTAYTVVRTSAAEEIA